MDAVPIVTLEASQTAGPEGRRLAFTTGPLSRVLVAALLAGALAACLAIADLMIETGWSSNVDVAIAVTLALGLGTILSANYPRVIRLADRLFFPRHYAVNTALERIAGSLRERNAEISDRVACDIAEVLGVASVAIFTRTEDDGYVRRAASGWQDGTIWHLLPREALTLALEAPLRVVGLAHRTDLDVALPEGEVRPCLAVTLRRHGRVRGAILLGPEDGAMPHMGMVHGLSALLGEICTG